MEDFLHHLKSKTYRKRTVALMENGSWAPIAAKNMRKLLEEMKDITVCDKVVTIKSAMKESTIADMEALADELIAK